MRTLYCVYHGRGNAADSICLEQQSSAESDLTYLLTKPVHRINCAVVVLLCCAAGGSCIAAKAMPVMLRCGVRHMRLYSVYALNGSSILSSRPRLEYAL